MNIRTLVRRAYSGAKAKGFHDTGATFGDRIALVHSELSEALEAFRELDNESFDAVSQPLYRSAITGNLTRSSSEYAPTETDFSRTVPNKPEGVWSELADVVIRVADMCGLYGIDLNKAIELKMAYNKTRPMLHGKRM